MLAAVADRGEPLRDGFTVQRELRAAKYGRPLQRAGLVVYERKSRFVRCDPEESEEPDPDGDAQIVRTYAEEVAEVRPEELA